MGIGVAAAECQYCKKTRGLAMLPHLTGGKPRQARTSVAPHHLDQRLEHSPEIGCLTRCLCLWLALLILALLFAMCTRALLRRPAAVWALIHRGGSVVSGRGCLRPGPVS